MGLVGLFVLCVLWKVVSVWIEGCVSMCFVFSFSLVLSIFVVMWNIVSELILRVNSVLVMLIVLWFSIVY